MGDKIVQRKPTAPVAQDELDMKLAAFAAQKQFINASINMGWQLGLMVLIPVFIGVKLDDHFKTSPSYTLAALVLAIGGAVWVVGSNIKQVRKDQAKSSGGKV